MIIAPLATQPFTTVVLPLLAASTPVTAARTVVTGAVAYGAMVLLLRLSGKRTLAQLNAFDLVVTVALGSLLATTAVSSGTGLVQGLAAMLVLVTGQLVVTWLSVRSRAARQAVRASPSLLVSNGRLLDDELASQRITTNEVEQAVRASGIGDLSLVGVVILETDGSLSVVPSDHMGDRSALGDGAPPPTDAT